MKPLLFAAAIALLALTGHAQSDAELLARRVANAYGVASFHQVERIDYTFHVQLPNQKVTRQWQWEPKKRRVTRIAPDGTTTTYVRKAMTVEEQAIDREFINDQYWLLFPFHLVWDEVMLTMSEQPEPLPAGQGDARRLTVQYPAEGGYTPGDAYDLYLNDNDHIVMWAFRKGGAPEPTRITTWGPPVNYGPIDMSTEHVGPQGQFRLWFTDMKVVFTGSDERFWGIR